MSITEASRRQSTALYVAGIALPILVVVLARYMGPAESRAAGVTPPPEAVELPVLRTLEPERGGVLEAALQRSDALHAAGPSVSPFPNISPALLPDHGAGSDTPGDEPTTPRPSVETESHDFNVSAILSLRPGPFAVIDGRLLREGQAITPAWRLVDIAPRHRRVLIEDRLGRRVEVSLATP